MKVRNSKACLVNIHVDGDYVRIGPGQEADVPEKAVASLVKAGVLEVVKGGRAPQAAADAPAKDDKATSADAGAAAKTE